MGMEKLLGALFIQIPKTVPPSSGGAAWHWRPGLSRAGVLLCLALPVLAAADPAATVEQQDRMFHPDRIVLHKGEVVRFTNTDPYAHQLYVESEAMHYESGIQDPGATRDITFASDGTFQVRCAIHPRMRLNVDVR